MKINRLDAHDRLLCFKEHQHRIGAFIDNIIKELPFGKRPFYIFIIHKKTLGIDEQVSLVQQGIYKTLEDAPEAFMVLQARLSKPKAEPNTSLVKVYPGTDVIKRIWQLPERETFEQFLKDTIFQDQFITTSILAYQTNKKSLEQLEADDPQSVHEFNYAMKLANGKHLIERIPIYRPREEKPKLQTSEAPSTSP